MAHRLVQHHAGPAIAEDDDHLTGWGGHRPEIYEGLAQRLVDMALPVGRVEVALVGETAAAAVGAGLHLVALADHNRDVDPYERADVGDAAAVGADDLHRLPDATDRRHHLAHPRVLAAGIGVDIGQKLGLGRKRDLV